MSSRLARTIAKANKPRQQITVKQGLITTAYSGVHEAAVEIEGEIEPNVKALDHVQLVAGLGCWVLMLGRGRWIIIGTIAQAGFFPGGFAPAGAYIDYFGSVAPDGWMLMTGQTVVNAQTLYPASWANLPTAWRSGADLIFPDTRGKFTINIDPSDATMDAVGEMGGAKTRTLVEANLPAHTHGVGTLVTGNQSQDHTHTVTTGTESIDHSHSLTESNFVKSFGGGDAYLMAGAQGHAVYGPYNLGSGGTGGRNNAHTHSGTTSGMNVSHNHAISGSTASVGSGTAFSIVPPFVVTLKIVKMH